MKKSEFLIYAQNSEPMVVEGDTMEVVDGLLVIKLEGDDVCIAKRWDLVWRAPDKEEE